jgi:hypothetical protein
MALWVDEWVRTESGREVVVYFVGRSGDRALLEIVRVQGNADNELERAIAIKCVLVFEALSASPEHAPSGAMLRDDGIAPTVSSGSKMPDWAVLFQLGGAGSVDPLQGMAVFGAGFGLRVGRVELEGLAITRLATPLKAQSAVGNVRATEMYAGGSLRGGVSLGAFRPGASFDAGARFLDAEGETRGGAQGA